MRHPKSLSVSYKLLIINSSILSQQKSDGVGNTPALTIEQASFRKVQPELTLQMRYPQITS